MVYRHLIAYQVEVKSALAPSQNSKSKSRQKKETLQSLSAHRILCVKILLGNVLLSRNVSPTTIGAKELNFCVRHGN
ncbi:hypothetical protein CDL68_05355, partial [Staphylococcus delphini]